MKYSVFIILIFFASASPAFENESELYEDCVAIKNEDGSFSKSPSCDEIELRCTAKDNGFNLKPLTDCSAKDLNRVSQCVFDSSKVITIPETHKGPETDWIFITTYRSTFTYKTVNRCSLTAGNATGSNDNSNLGIKLNPCQAVGIITKNGGLIANPCANGGLPRDK